MRQQFFQNKTLLRRVLAAFQLAELQEGGGRCSVRSASGRLIIPCASSGGSSSLIAQVSSSSSA
jgi:hypothetical protein